MTCVVRHYYGFVWIPSELSKIVQDQSFVVLGTLRNVDIRNLLFTAMVRRRGNQMILHPECIIMDRWCAQALAATIACWLSVMVTVAANTVGQAFI
jgi:hypothetical protein